MGLGCCERDFNRPRIMASVLMFVADPEDELGGRDQYQIDLFRPLPHHLLPSFWAPLSSVVVIEIISILLAYARSSLFFISFIFLSLLSTRDCPLPFWHLLHQNTFHQTWLYDTATTPLSSQQVGLGCRRLPAPWTKYLKMLSNDGLFDDLD